jgi:hypothetical protein
MTQREILEELSKLTTTERLTVIESALHQLREELHPRRQSATPTERKRQLMTAAEALLPDYTADSELTVFTSLDSEDFHAEG